MPSRVAVLAIVIILSCLSQACVVLSYDVRPETAWKLPDTPATEDETLYYRVGHPVGITLGGAVRLPSIFKEVATSRDLRQLSAAPEKGTFIDVKIKDIPPGAVAAIWGYIASGLLLIVPAYSGEDGFYVRFHVYHDGTEARIYEYRILRRAFAWLPVLPLVWLNLLTDSEEDAFRAVTRQFFVDVARDGMFPRKPGNGDSEKLGTNRS